MKKWRVSGLILFGYQKIKDFVDSIAPSLSNRVKLFEGRENIFEHFGLNREIEKAFKPESLVEKWRIFSF